MSEKLSYKSAGVDVDKANLFIERIKPLVQRTARSEVIGGLGGFAGFFRLNLTQMAKPVIVAATDGVGTKLIVAKMANRHDTVGIDLVAMSVNDVLVHGAEPLFFLDYLATGKLDVNRCSEIIAGITKGCVEAGCALLGGETAEMPGFYGEDEYDLAGFCVGIVDETRIVDGSAIVTGDVILGLASSGLHSNGYSLVRKIFFDRVGYKITEVPEGFDEPLGEILLKPTRIYVRSVLNVLRHFPVHGIVHITGGGFMDNIPRIVPEMYKAVIRRESWNIPRIFNLIQEKGELDDSEMFRVYNMGIGMMLIVPERVGKKIIDHLGQMGEVAYMIGVVEKREGTENRIQFV
ncbi:MAG: phosphoribosylformylglycinamidine cyclo-ligase [Syntrophales bacterium]|nr:phosphoribosylformylglycinamidine cyclo-ligase [Syntrophales bacterium]